nr:unnamed protein product [Digitaria exilis]
MASSAPTSGKKSLNTVTLLFKLPYYTQWGQSLLIAGSEPPLGSWNVKQGLSLSPVHQDSELIWCGSVSVAAGFTSEYKYYVVDDNKNVLRFEAGEKRKLVLPEGVQEGDVIEIRDWWQDASDALFLRSAFKNVVFNDTEGVKKEVQSVSLNKSLDPEGNPSLELGPNREVDIDLSSPKQSRYVILSDGALRDAPWRGAGVAVPVFSIRSDEDLGVGEFLDLKLLVDWAVNSGFHLVQLLPINDTSVHGMWWDSYPYSSLSVFALHPLYLRVQALSDAIPADVKEEIQQAKKHLDKKDVDYEASLSTKLSIAKKIFNLEKDKVLNSSSFKQFLSENEEWLKPYAAFCFLRDFFETSDHSQWGHFSQFSKEKLEKLISEGTLHHDVIRFHYYVQYHLYMQLSEAAAYARKKKVILKGDLPIGVDRNSVDTWVYPTLFRMNTATGAPPDYFDKNGQNWGFPTYNWEEMSKDNYGWWRARLTQMAKYFTAYRIDHILGFFRIWELPEHAATGLVGKFRPSIPLSQNIVLIRDPEDATKFYPRFNLEDTSSFRDLDEHRFVLPHVMIALHYVRGGKKMKEEEVDLLALKDKYTTRPAPEETINDPTNPKHYWRFRVHVTLESLLDDKDIQATIKDLVTSSGRSFPGKKVGGADESGEKLSKVQLNGKA